MTYIRALQGTNWAEYGTVYLLQYDRFLKFLTDPAWLFKVMNIKLHKSFHFLRLNWYIIQLYPRIVKKLICAEQILRNI